MSCGRCQRVRRWWNGLRGWGRVASRRDIAPRKLIVKRREICQGCPKAERSERTGEATRCRVCGCFLYAKTQLLDAECPTGRW